MSVCYAAFVPELHYDDDDENYVGGLFWDGRSPSLQDQAGIPLLNPVEMGNRDKQMVAEKVKRTPYYNRIVQIYGETEHADSLFAHVTDALAAYQASRRSIPLHPSMMRIKRKLSADRTGSERQGTVQR